MYNIFTGRSDMEERPLKGIMTRSKAAHFRDSLLAPPRLDLQKITSEPLNSAQPPVMPSDNSVQVSGISVTTNSSASFDCHSSPTNQPAVISPDTARPQSTLASTDSTPPPLTTVVPSTRTGTAPTRPIIRDLVVSCSACNVIYQQQPGCARSVCPVCAHSKADKQRVEAAISEFNTGNAQLLQRLTELENAIVSLREEVITLKEASLGKPLVVSKDHSIQTPKVNAALSESNLEELMDTDAAPELIASLDSKWKQLDAARSRLDTLLSQSETKVNRLEILCDHAKRYITEMGANTNSRRSDAGNSASELTTQLPKEAPAESALIVGDSNVARFAKAALRMLPMNDRFEVRGTMGCQWPTRLTLLVNGLTIKRVWRL